MPAPVNSNVMSSIEEIEIRRQKPKIRGVFWYVRFVFGCFAAAFLLLLLSILVSMPFIGFEFLDWLVDTEAAMGMFWLISIAVLSPLVYRHLM